MDTTRLPQPEDDELDFSMVCDLIEGLEQGDYLVVRADVLHHELRCALRETATSHGVQRPGVAMLRLLRVLVDRRAVHTVMPSGQVRPPVERAG